MLIKGEAPNDTQKYNNCHNFLSESIILFDFHRGIF